MKASTGEQEAAARMSKDVKRRRAKKKLYARLKNDSRVSRSVHPRSNAETKSDQSVP